MKRILCLLLCLSCLLLPGCRKNPYEGLINPVAIITMADGRAMYFELHLEVAPNTVANFTKLANEGFYDGLEFFRIMPGVLAQAGCPNNDGTGNAGHTIRGEFEKNGAKNGLSHIRGVLSMARITDDYDSASSQFFIMQGNYPEYDGLYAAFGTAMDASTLTVIDQIATQRVDINNYPMVRQVIATVRVNNHNQELPLRVTPIVTPKPEKTPEP